MLAVKLRKIGGGSVCDGIVKNLTWQEVRAAPQHPHFSPIPLTRTPQPGKDKTCNLSSRERPQAMPTISTKLTTQYFRGAEL